MRVQWQGHRDRRGVVAVLAAMLLVFLVGMFCFSVDLSYISMVHGELQRTADATALAAAGMLLDKDALKGAPNSADEITSARSNAALYASLNKAGGATIAIPTGSTSDFIVGNMKTTSYPAVIQSSTTAPTAVKVAVRRDSTANGKLALFFGGVLNKKEQSLAAQATAYFEMGIKGFKVTDSSTTANSLLLPYTMLVDDWDAALKGSSGAPDQFSVNSTTRTVSSGSDGVREVKLFPLASGKSNGKGGGVTPGNFGTVDIGSPNNSTADLARQILYGPNASDFSYFPNNTVQLGSTGTLSLNGDTGVSAGVKDELASIRGQPRIIPLYSKVTGNGNNSVFTIVRFVGCTVVDVQLTGSLSNKYVQVQPAYAIDGSAIGGGQNGTTSSFVTRPLALIE